MTMRWTAIRTPVALSNPTILSHKMIVIALIPLCKEAIYGAPNRKIATSDPSDRPA